jgi:sugar/nucleoside kinase (ribokinase family)
MMERTRRLGVLGTLVWDTIWTVDDLRQGTPFESWGGAAYSFAAAAAARPHGWEVVPLVKVGMDLEAEARAFLAGLPGFSVGPSVLPVPVPNNRVELRYTDSSRRGERQTGAIPGWEWEELRPHLAGLDALYVNFISGLEMTLPVAEKLRSAFEGPLYSDLHSLFLSCPGAHQRTHRRLPAWERWAACFHAVQVNEDELGTLAEVGEMRDETLVRVVNAGPGLVTLTMGASGVAYAADASVPHAPCEWPRWTQGREASPGAERRTGIVPPPDVSAGGDPTGAGDVWGVTFFSSLLAGLSLEEAMRAGHRAAGRKLHHRGASDLYPVLAS